jgi:hypothetical protein
MAMPPVPPPVALVVPVLASQPERAKALTRQALKKTRRMVNSCKEVERRI